MDFQLGLWTHAYQWNNSPNASHVIEGLTPQTQAPYSRDALTILLKECPNITGVTLRIHGESGVPEGSYDLWRTIFSGCVRSGRRIEVELLFSKKAAAWVKDKSWHPSQETKLLKDGRLKMSLKVADNEELVGWILSFGGGVKVTRPETLREKVKGEAKEIFRL